MEKQIASNNTTAWRFQVWLSFLLSFGMSIVGVLMLPDAGFWIKGFMIMGLIFTVGSSFSLAKTIRDDHESQKIINRVNEAKTAKILQEYE